MNGKEPLTKTTLERTLNALHVALPGILEKGKTIEPDQVNGYLIDTLFAMAIFAGWIAPPISQWGPEDQYFLKPEFRSNSPYPATVTLGGFKVSEKTHDDFIALFWATRPDVLGAKNASRTAFIAKLLDSGFDPVGDLREDRNTDRFDEQPSKAVPNAPDAPASNRNPAQVLIKGKTDLGLTWAKLAKSAGKHLQQMADEEMKDLAGVAGKVTVELKVDSIFRLLRGQNVRPDNAKSLAAALNVDWRLLVWPTTET